MPYKTGKKTKKSPTKKRPIANKSTVGKYSGEVSRKKK